MFGKRKPDSPVPSESQSETQRSATPRQSRPDASAVLERQPQPPVRPGASAAPAAAAPATRKPDPAPAAAADQEMKKLIVGRDIRLAGEITACDKLVVEGQVEADLADAQVLEIAEHGLFKGRAEVDVAEVSGTFDGELTVRERLILRASGQVKGKLHYAELEIERGGRVNGQIEEIGAGGASKPAAAKPAGNGTTQKPDAEERPAAGTGSPAEPAPSPAG
jgi:cytoskeletal protein CcmA (bactofilin family)